MTDKISERLTVNGKPYFSYFFWLSVVPQIFIIGFISSILYDKIGVNLIISIIIATIFEVMARKSYMVCSSVFIWWRQSKGKYRNVEKVDEPINPILLFIISVLFVTLTTLSIFYANTTGTEIKASEQIESVTLLNTPQYHQLKERVKSDSISSKSKYRASVEYFNSKAKAEKEQFLKSKSTVLEAKKIEIQRYIKLNDVPSESIARLAMQKIESMAFVSKYTDSINAAKYNHEIELSNIRAFFNKGVEKIESGNDVKKLSIREMANKNKYFVDKFILLCIALTVVFTFQFECERRIKIRVKGHENEKELERVLPKDFDNEFLSKSLGFKHETLRNWVRRGELDRVSEASKKLKKHGLILEVKNNYPFIYKNCA